MQTINPQSSVQTQNDSGVVQRPLFDKLSLMNASTSLKERIQSIFSDVFESPTYDLAVIKRHFSPKYIQHVDGQVLDFDQFAAHIKTLKGVIASTKMYFEHILEEGNCVSTVHHVEAKKTDGSEIKADVIAYFEFEDDQLVLCKELTRMTHGSEEDADLGSRH